ncbi:damage-control phosphatase ARMT1 family protein [Sulfuricurvum sp.]|uniref:damage-control phosphatase ARMT1 family protein n=1 Tax=Sulfuricurvum sp. TaxID=2025608 RepID=UPI002E310E57|nr:ARMT1-like domain-containing protein [Sulfuricurvum sp.]HEX5329328.1 ARMT1-like domain-containing protein [Sulfuricurvum sp.]
MGQSHRRSRRSMTIQSECIGCITAQSKRVCEAIHADETLSKQIISYVETALQNADFTLSPPVIAAPLYEQMAILAQSDDLYEEQKQHASAQAKTYTPFLEETIQNSDDPLIAILKTAVVGNVIDLAAEVSFDLHEAIMSVFNIPFAHDDTETLRATLSQAKTLLYIGDNAGEHLFDALAIRFLQKFYPHIHVTYLVRGKPIINDVTMKEAQEAGIDKICTLMDSGVPTPGFVYELASAEARKLFDHADLIIAKGMGNYECMTPQKRRNICFLLKVKCSVVAASLGHEIGSIVCKID